MTPRMRECSALRSVRRDAGCRVSPRLPTVLLSVSVLPPGRVLACSTSMLAAAGRGRALALAWASYSNCIYSLVEVQAKKRLALLLHVGDEVVAVLALLEAGERHLGAGDVLLGVLEVLRVSCVQGEVEREQERGEGKRGERVRGESSAERRAKSEIRHRARERGEEHGGRSEEDRREQRKLSVAPAPPSSAAPPRALSRPRLPLPTSPSRSPRLLLPRQWHSPRRGSAPPR